MVVVVVADVDVAVTDDVVAKVVVDGVVVDDGDGDDNDAQQHEFDANLEDKSDREDGFRYGERLVPSWVI